MKAIDGPSAVCILGVKGTAVIGLALLILAGTAGGQEHDDAAASVAESLHYTRVYADSSGTSHFADEKMPLALVDLGKGLPRIPASTPIAATGFTFFCFPPGTLVDWHAAPRRQFYFILTGGVEIEVADGETRQFVSGSVLLGESTQGPGVRARWMDAERGCAVVAPLAEQEASLAGSRALPPPR